MMHRLLVMLMAKSGVITFTPLSLFANGEQGAWYDPSDLTTMFQDAAGTTPVTAAEQPVGRINDKSGRGNHATQETATKRPILNLIAGKYSLLFDGIDDALVTSSIDFTATDKMTVVAGRRVLATPGVLAGAYWNSDDSFWYFGYAFPTYTQSSIKGTLQAFQAGPATITRPDTAVETCSFDIAALTADSAINARYNAVPITTTKYGAPNGANLGSEIISIGYFPGVYLNGHIYSLIVRGAQSTDAQIVAAEKYVADKTGVTL